MKLTIDWVNATRSGEERKRIEEAYKERLLSLFDESPDKAREAREAWVRAQRPAIHHWTTYNKIAAITASTDLLPTERMNACFVVRFDNDTV